MTERQRCVLDFIRHAVAVRGGAPTYREIAAEFGFHSTKAAVDHVAALVRRGYLRVHRGRSRGIEVLVSPAEQEEDTVAVPLLGRIAAGRASEEAETWAGRVRVDKALLGTASRRRLFALQVTGDSMIGRGIHEGDIAVAEADAAPHTGDVVVALIDQESTLKSLAYGANGNFLKSENPCYPDLFPVDQMTIQGVVRALIRKVI